MITSEADLIPGGSAASNGVYVKVMPLNQSAASCEAYGSSSAPEVRGGVTSNDYTTAALTRFAALSSFCSPAPPVEVKLTLPHKRHLVPVQQRAKEREQLKVWGLRR